MWILLSESDLCAGDDVQQFLRILLNIFVFSVI